ncbi:30S ribosomal protein S13 [candidate division WOR-1 bacterium RIFOXYA12_FULL_43_27]|uniref:Small ribosomal subunit protein uS13 n=1 Tax=candidate division WOR-1 bacterium RIFOXYC2_FULL_46_14 TaxID=1802587 RepID=A0A1F4U5U0_UNCSA|nr:MAG: 30S ribosomal protein S13 [candidate division WOR-1 bacterium RIFOXYA12_FULL_43_27]OGC20426.1 MAG: 30S ribosomal protein S13 [candidate division WOR-1 bacterium RIFOXYB2_FULL_46_45]OGC31837.1 MAG: 30S ribosomal protein S13 [candidate division WOR-1 bacterium RIFOXYA2_FULL_46_56]OGC40271.1 MAG: 30S ribosomal protein S13 [candidate division WOR-1 bacterium RIFOXYC2_FULL_46_14]
MARIAGVDLPLNKNIEVALTYIYGIGSTLSATILKEIKIDPFTKVKNLTEAQVVALREALKAFMVEGDLRKEVSQNIKRLIDMGSYRGNRHRKNLPVHGQRSKTNARTRRGTRKTVGSGRRKEEGKT